MKESFPRSRPHIRVGMKGFGMSDFSSTARRALAQTTMPPSEPVSETADTFHYEHIHPLPIEMPRPKKVRDTKPKKYKSKTKAKRKAQKKARKKNGK